MKYKIWMLVYGLIFALATSSCSVQVHANNTQDFGQKSNAKSDNAIQMDIMTNEEMFEKYDLTVESMNIEKRQTNEEEKTDYVWVSLKASNDEFSFDASYFLVYVLYNDGWHLEVCDRKDNEYKAKIQPDYNIAIPVLESEFITHTYLSTEVKSDNIIEYHFKAVEEISEFLCVEYQITVSASFSPHSGWSVNSPKREGKELIWNIEGEWEYHDDSVNVYLDILHYDPEQDVLTIKYHWETNNYSMSSGEYVYYPLKDWPHSGNYDYLKVNKETASVENGFAVDNLIHTSLYVAGDKYKLQAKEQGCGILFWFHDGHIPYNIWLDKVK